MGRNATYVAALVAALAGPAVAAPTDSLDGSAADFDVVAPLPANYRAASVQVDEHLGATLPLDTPFRTSDGALTTLGQVLHGDLPTILTFNYSDCPMLCSMQLNGLTAALPEVAKGTPPLQLGKQFRIVTIDLEPNEPLAKLAAMKQRYIDRLAQLGAPGDAAAGWTFLAAAIPARCVDPPRRRRDRLPLRLRTGARGVGSPGSADVREHGRHDHSLRLRYRVPAGDDARVDLVKAGVAEAASTVGFMLRCYHFDPDANSYAHAGVIALRLAAGGAVVLLLAGFWSHAPRPPGEVRRGRWGVNGAMS